MRKEAINPLVCADRMLILSFLRSENKVPVPCYDDVKGLVFLRFEIFILVFFIVAPCILKSA